jgi:hypothetical protein
MARVLEVVDVSGDKDVPSGDTATLEDDGSVTYKGTRARAIMSKWLVKHPASEVFDKMAGWSNGYVALMERE